MPTDPKEPTTGVRQRRSISSTPPPDNTIGELPQLQGTGVYDRDDIERIKLLGAKILPPRPSTLVPTVRLPAPPLLDAKTARLNLARVLAEGFRDVAWWRYHERINVDRLWNPGTPECDAILAAVEMMITAEIRPIAWILFSFDVWDTIRASMPDRRKGAQKGVRRARRRRTAPWKFVFSTKRMEDRYEWYEDVRIQCYAYPTMIVAPSLRDIDADWQAMWRSITTESPKDALALRIIIDRYFSGHTFEERVNRARSEARRMQMQIDSQVANGEAPWLRIAGHQPRPTSRKVDVEKIVDAAKQGKW